MRLIAFIASLAVLIGTSGLTFLGTAIGVIGGAAGVCALVMLIRLKRSVDELEAAVERQAQTIHNVTKKAPPPPNKR